MDYSSDTAHSVVAGPGDQLHDRRIYSHPAGHCHYRCGYRVHLGTQRLKNGQHISDITVDETGGNPVNSREGAIP